jgi:hypothetical protein
MSLVQMGTGLTIPLTVQSPELTDAFEKRLKTQLKKSS